MNDAHHEILQDSSPGLNTCERVVHCPGTIIGGLSPRQSPPQRTLWRTGRRIRSDLRRTKSADYNSPTARDSCSRLSTCTVTIHDRIHKPSQTIVSGRYNSRAGNISYHFQILRKFTDKNGWQLREVETTRKIPHSTILENSKIRTLIHINIGRSV